MQQFPGMTHFPASQGNELPLLTYKERLESHRTYNRFQEGLGPPVNLQAKRVIPVNLKKCRKNIY